jgi:hypothetical protein
MMEEQSDGLHAPTDMSQYMQTLSADMVSAIPTMKPFSLASLEIEGQGELAEEVRALKDQLIQIDLKMSSQFQLLFDKGEQLKARRGIALIKQKEVSRMRRSILFRDSEVSRASSIHTRASSIHTRSSSINTRSSSVNGRQCERQTATNVDTGESGSNAHKQSVHARRALSTGSDGSPYRRTSFDDRKSLKSSDDSFDGSVCGSPLRRSYYSQGSESRDKRASIDEGAENKVFPKCSSAEKEKAGKSVRILSICESPDGESVCKDCEDCKDCKDDVCKDDVCKDDVYDGNNCSQKYSHDLYDTHIHAHGENGLSIHPATSSNAMPTGPHVDYSTVSDTQLLRDRVFQLEHELSQKNDLIDAQDDENAFLNSTLDTLEDENAILRNQIAEIAAQMSGQV